MSATSLSNMDFDEELDEDDFVLIGADGEEEGVNKCFQPGNSRDDHCGSSNDEDFYELIYCEINETPRQRIEREPPNRQIQKAPPIDSQSTLDDLVITLKVKLSSMAPEPKKRLIKYVERTTHSLGRNLQEKVEHLIKLISTGTF